MKDVRLGTWITVPHPTVVELLAGMPFEWLCVDMEHSPTTLLDLQNAVGLGQARGKKMFVRVAMNSHKEIKFPLDAGVDGIIIPMVNSAGEAREALSHCLYPPLGRRGVGLARAQRFGLGFEAHLRKNLDELEIFVQVEHIQAVEQIEEIVSLERLTGVFLGPYDLSGSMGIPGRFDEPRMVAAIEKVAKATRAAGKRLGIHVIAPNAGEVKRYVDMGYDFVAFSIDTLFLARRAEAELNQLERLLGAPEAKA